MGPSLLVTQLWYWPAQRCSARSESLALPLSHSAAVTDLAKFWHSEAVTVNFRDWALEASAGPRAARRRRVPRPAPLSLSRASAAASKQLARAVIGTSTYCDDPDSSGGRFGCPLAVGLARGPECH